MYLFIIIGFGILIGLLLNNLLYGLAISIIATIIYEKFFNHSEDKKDTKSK